MGKEGLKTSKSKKYQKYQKSIGSEKGQIRDKFGTDLGQIWDKKGTKKRPKISARWGIEILFENNAGKNWVIQKGW